ncbi:response regulator transcription factor [Nakamurella sp. A5-74]|uniref:Response regulator transcription factor n=1 Tax=Nakamurella sp. A5-74 TaxID=3158264 RepID=A0AAU8DI80_9ACTN
MRALVVEDEKMLAESIRRGLINAGFVVDLAHDGMFGQRLAIENPYDVIVLDIMLPGRNGYEVLRTLRGLAVWTPTLMLTAKDGEYDQTDAFELGADDYLTKPFSFPVLVARLRALVRRAAPERPVTLVLGDLRLDPNRHTVTAGDVPLSLTSREFAVLQYLLRHSENVVSKTEILDNVWDPAFDGSDNIVEVYIAHLRHKLGVVAGRPTIQTVRGMGYRLSVTPA